MRPELVLNEDEKKRRFKKLLRKKEEEASNVTSSPEPRYSDDESLFERVHEMPPLEPIETNPKLGQCRILNIKYTLSFSNPDFFRLFQINIQ